MKSSLAIASALALSLGSPAAAAVTLITNGSGQLIGATGVDVGGTLYDVGFVDGTCASVFSGCDSVSDFDFQDGITADVAANALLAQVLTGTFDTDYTLTFGCNPNNYATCLLLVPYGLSPGVFDARLAFNDNTVADLGTAGYSSSPTTFDTAPGGNGENFVFARFTLSAGVPEPTTWTMMLLGFGAVGFAMRRRSRVELTVSQAALVSDHDRNGMSPREQAAFRMGLVSAFHPKQTLKQAEAECV